jgi:iron complex transport system substrate-binding protein
LDGIGDTGAISEPNLEVILTLAPDLILGSKQRYEAIYDQLSQIAPTVLTESLRVPWQDNLLVHADAVNRQDEAAQLLADYDAHVADVQALLGDALDTMTISIIRFRPGQVRLYLKSSYIGYILQDVGLARPASQNEDVFSSEISLEEVQAVDADYIFITGYAQDDSEQDRFLESQLWQTLGAVQSGHAIDVNDDTWIAGLGVQSAHLVLEDLKAILAGPSVLVCESGMRAVVDAAGVSVCVPENPQRVVGLMEADVDALLALGISPVGSTNGRGQATPPRYRLRRPRSRSCRAE